MALRLQPEAQGQGQCDEAKIRQFAGLEAETKAETNINAPKQL